MSDAAPESPDLAQGVPSDSLPEGAMLAGMFGETRVILTRSEGRIFALSGTCTHLSAPLENGIVSGGELRCPFHHARFCLRSGAAVSAPALEPLARFDAVETGGTIRVTGRRPRPTPANAPRDPGRVVIIGAGAAGHACADMLARHGVGDRVTLISAEPRRPYDRTFVSKQVLSGAAAAEDAALPEPGSGTKGAQVTYCEDEVVRLDPQARRVELASGDVIAFDKAVIATGSDAVRPDLPGFDDPRVHVLRSLDDATRLIAASGTARRVAIVGASFIGLEAAAAMVARGIHVEVVALEAVPLANILGDDLGRFVQRLHEAEGVVFHLGRSAEAFGDGTLVLDDGTKVAADAVVLGMGVRPRLALAQQAGLSLADAAQGGGIAVDERLETDHPGIFAVGDVACYPDASGRRLRVEHWAHAQRQGQHVARVLLGAAESFEDVPFFWTKHYAANLRYVGHAASARSVDIDGTLEDHDFAARIMEGGDLRAVVTCGRDRLALRYAADWEATRRQG